MNSVNTATYTAFPKAWPANRPSNLRFGMQHHAAPAQGVAPARTNRSISGWLQAYINVPVSRGLLAMRAILFPSKSPAQKAQELVEAISSDDAQRARAVLARVPRISQAAVVTHPIVHQDINQGHNQGDTPLHLAVLNSTPEMVQILLARVPAQARAMVINHTDNQGNTPLHIAVWQGNAAMVQALVNAIPQTERAAVINRTDAQGRTPLQLAALAAPRLGEARPAWMPQLPSYLALARTLLANGGDQNQLGDDVFLDVVVGHME